MLNGGDRKQSSRRYYGLLYRLDGSYRWLLWYSDEVDGLYIEDGRFPSFASADALSRYAAARGLAMDTVGATVHDVDAVVEWLSRPSRIAVDSAEFLAAWNLAQDAAATVDWIWPIEMRWPIERTRSCSGGEALSGSDTTPPNLLCPDCFSCLVPPHLL